MNIFTEYFLPCFYCFGASAAIAVVFNIRGIRIVTTALGSAIGWLTYLLFAGVFYNDIPQYFIAAAVISLYSEIAARVAKTPVTVYLVISIISLVPGGDIYRTMESAIIDGPDVFVSKLLYTFEIAGSIALGIFAVSSIVRLIFTVAMHFKRPAAAAKK